LKRRADVIPQGAQIVYIDLLYLGFLLTAILYLAIIMRYEMARTIGDKSSMTEISCCSTTRRQRMTFQGVIAAYTSPSMHARPKAWAAKQPDKPSLSDSIEKSAYLINE
jgi:hypothetical protein